MYFYKTIFKDTLLSFVYSILYMLYTETTNLNFDLDTHLGFQKKTRPLNNVYITNKVGLRKKVCMAAYDAL